MNLKKLKTIPPWEWPENAAKLILETLADGQALKSDRLLAADLAGEFTILSEEVADTLLDIVGSHEESPELRSRAAVALGPGLEEADTGDYENPYDPPALSEPCVQKIQRMLRTQYSDAQVPKDVRRAVLEASVRNPQSWHTGAIRSAYDSNDEEWKLTAVFCMRYVKGFESQILKALKSHDPNIRYHAVCAAGNWEIDEAWPHIARLLTSADTDKPLLLAAIEAAASIRPGDTNILEHLVDSDDEDISEAATDALMEAEYAAGWDSEDDVEDEEDEDEDFEHGEDEDDDDLNGR
jgi:hypothetical protein